MVKKTKLAIFETKYISSLVVMSSVYPHQSKPDLEKKFTKRTFDFFFFFEKKNIRNILTFFASKYDTNNNLRKNH